MTCSDAAERYGFGHPSAFSRAYSRHFGMSPKQSMPRQGAP